jgi:hypothetical protein
MNLERVFSDANFALKDGQHQISYSLASEEDRVDTKGPISAPCISTFDLCVTIDEVDVINDIDTEAVKYLIYYYSDAPRITYVYFRKSDAVRALSRFSTAVSKLYKF